MKRSKDTPSCPQTGLALSADEVGKAPARKLVTKRKAGAIRPKGIAAQAILILWAIIQIFPLYWLFTFSLKDNNEIFAGNLIGLPEVWRFENYKVALFNGKVGLYFFNSVLVTASTIALVCIIAVMASYALVRMRWKLRTFTQVALMMGITIPLHAVLLPLFLMLRETGVIKTYFALILPYTAFSLPMAIMICSSFMVSIPCELEEAACLDGCGVFRMFFRIIAPMMKPAIATVSIFSFLQSWNELMFAEILVSNAKLKTITVGIQTLVGEYAVDWGPIGAALVVATFPTVICYIILSKHVQSSMIAGAIKQ